MSASRTPTLRVAREGDAEAIAAIYAPIVRETAISFELEPPSPEEMRRRLLAAADTYPWIVCEGEEGVIGYAIAGRLHARAGYQWSAEVSVYVRDGFRGRRIGRALYTALLEALTWQGIVSAYGAISLPNKASVALHEALGFERVSLLPAVGYKLGEWRDVGWWHRTLARRALEPEPPRPFSSLLGSPELASALAAGQAVLDR